MPTPSPTPSASRPEKSSPRSSKFSVVSVICSLSDPAFALNAEDALFSPTGVDVHGPDGDENTSNPQSYRPQCLSASSLDAESESNGLSLAVEGLDNNPTLSTRRPSTGSNFDSVISASTTLKQQDARETLAAFLRRNTTLGSQNKLEIFALLLKLRAFTEPLTILQFLFLRFQLPGSSIDEREASPNSVSQLECEGEETINSNRSSIDSLRESAESLQTIQEIENEFKLLNKVSGYHDPSHLLEPKHITGDFDASIPRIVRPQVEILAHQLFGEEVCCQFDGEMLQLTASLPIRIAVLVFLEEYLSMFPQDFISISRNTQPDKLDVLVHLLVLILESLDAKFWRVNHLVEGGSVDEDLIFPQLFKTLYGLMTVVGRRQSRPSMCSSTADPHEHVVNVASALDEFSCSIMLDAQKARESDSPQADSISKYLQSVSRVELSVRDHVNKELVRIGVYAMCENLRSYSNVAATLAAAEIPSCRSNAGYHQLFCTATDQLFFAIGDNTLDRITRLSETLMQISTESTRTKASRSTTGGSKSDRMSRRLSVTRLLPHKRWTSHVSSETINLSLVNVEAASIAVEMTLRLHYLYCTIPIHEFLCETTKAEIIMLTRFRTECERIQNRLVSDILTAESVTQRAEVIVHLFRIADSLSRLRSFHALMLVYNALQSQPIHRLRRTWALVEKDVPGHWEGLKDYVGFGGRLLQSRINERLCKDQQSQKESVGLLCITRYPGSTMLPRQSILNKFRDSFADRSESFQSEGSILSRGFLSPSPATNEQHEKYVVNSNHESGHNNHNEQHMGQSDTSRNRNLSRAASVPSSPLPNNSPIPSSSTTRRSSLASTHASRQEPTGKRSPQSSENSSPLRRPQTSPVQHSSPVSSFSPPLSRVARDKNDDERMEPYAGTRERHLTAQSQSLLSKLQQKVNHLSSIFVRDPLERRSMERSSIDNGSSPYEIYMKNIDNCTETFENQLQPSVRKRLSLAKGLKPLQTTTSPSQSSVSTVDSFSVQISSPTLSDTTSIATEERPSRKSDVFNELNPMMCVEVAESLDWFDRTNDQAADLSTKAGDALNDRMPKLYRTVNSKGLPSNSMLMFANNREPRTLQSREDTSIHNLPQAPPFSPSKPCMPFVSAYIGLLTRCHEMPNLLPAAQHTDKTSSRRGDADCSEQYVLNQSKLRTIASVVCVLRTCQLKPYSYESSPELQSFLQSPGVYMDEQSQYDRSNLLEKFVDFLPTSSVSQQAST